MSDRPVLSAYDEIHHERPAEYLTVDTLPQLAALLAPTTTTSAATTVSLRAAGCSIAEQALGDNTVLVLSPTTFGGIRAWGSDNGRAVVTVGAATPWGTVVKETLARGYMPPSLVTGEHITVGGSVSAGCISRFSHVWGSEHEQVVAVSVLLPGTTVPTTVRGDSPVADERELFGAITAGHGYAGVIVEVTVALRRVCDPGEAVCAETRVKRYQHQEASFDWKTLLKDLKDLGDATRTWRLGLADQGFETPLDADHFDALSTVGWFQDDGRVEAMLFRSRYVRRAVGAGPALPLYEGPTFVRLVAELAMGTFLANFGRGIYFDTQNPDPDAPFFNEVTPFAFFFGGNERARALFKPGGDLGAFEQFVLGLPPTLREVLPIGARMASVQQTMVLPHDGAVKLLDHLRSVATGPHPKFPRPTVFDVLYLPKDTRDAYLSPTHDHEGFAITVGTQHIGTGEMRDERELLADLATFTRHHHGRVSLVKTVEATPTDVKAMYATGLAAFRAVKARVDPTTVLRNGFYDTFLR